MGRPQKDKQGLSEIVILDEALALLKEVGVSELSFRKLAGRLGVTAMAVAHHVGSKEALLTKLATHAFRGMMAGKPKKTAEAELCRILVAYCERVLTHPQLTQYLLAAPNGEGSDLKPFNERICSLLEGLVKGHEVELIHHLLIDYTHGYGLSVAEGLAAGRRTLPSLEDYLSRVKWIIRQGSLSKP